MSIDELIGQRVMERREELGIARDEAARMFRDVRGLKSANSWRAHERGGCWTAQQLIAVGTLFDMDVAALLATE